MDRTYISHSEIRRGDVFYVDRIQTFGHEQRSGRPGIVVSNDVGNNRSDVVVIVWLTTQPKADIPTHVTVRATGTPSIALCEQLQTVDCSRLGTYCGSLTENEMAAVDNALAISLGLNLTGGGFQGRRSDSFARRPCCCPCRCQP